MQAAQIYVGDTLNFTTYVREYLPSDGWTLKFRLLPRSAGAAIAITTSQDATDTSLHRTQVTAATTAAWTSGEYSWHSYVEKGAESYSVASGQITLRPNPRTASTLDNRSVAKTALDNVRAVLSGKASSGVLSYSINGRALQNYSIEELLKLENKLVADVKREDLAEAMAAGQPSRRRVMVRTARA